MCPARLNRTRLACLLIGCLAVPPVSAQGAADGPILISSRETMDFDRPESWAMKYFASLSILSGTGAPKPNRTGEFEIAVEGGYIPTLSEEEMRVGFVGSKVEDLNRSSVFGRVRATVGLSRGFALTLALTPRVEIDGVTPELLAVAIARPLLERHTWRLGGRLHGQLGKIKGDLTCPRSIAGLGDSLLNPDDCLEPSRDEATLDYIGFELSVSRKTSSERWEPHLAISLNYLDLDFTVNARYSAFLDRAVLETSGYTYSLAGGLTYRLSKRIALSGELFYSPLDVVRSIESGRQNDALLNGRLLLRSRLR